MPYVNVHFSGIDEALDQYKRVSKRLSDCLHELDDVRRSMNYKLAGREKILNELCEMQVRLEIEMVSVHHLSEALTQIKYQYQDTEARNAQLVPVQSDSLVLREIGISVPWFPGPIRPVPVVPWSPQPILPIRVLPWRIDVDALLRDFRRLNPAYHPGFTPWKPRVLVEMIPVSGLKYVKDIFKEII